MIRRIRAPKPSVSPVGYSTLSQLSQPTKKIAGTFPVLSFGRVMKVRSLSPRLFVTQPYRTSACSNRSRPGCGAAAIGTDGSSDHTSRGEPTASAQISAKRQKAAIESSFSCREDGAGRDFLPLRILTGRDGRGHSPRAPKAGGRDYGRKTGPETSFARDPWPRLGCRSAAWPHRRVSQRRTRCFSCAL